jgi:uncharacterized protein YkwD
MRRIALLAAGIGLVALVACAPLKPGASPPISFGNAQPQAQELYSFVNNERAANGLGPVGWNDQLGGLAQGWSEHMAGTGDFSHQNLDALFDNPAYSGFSGLGENIIHAGCGASSASLHQAWMSSPLHRANILGNFNAIGIGVACNGGDLYAAEEFGR